MTEDAQSFAHSLQPYELFRVQSMATAVYQNVLEHDLRALGYQIERGKNHAPEVKGYTPECLESESQRSALIRQALEAKGLRGAEAASIAAHAGREEKLKLSPSELKKLHQAHAAEFGASQNASSRKRSSVIRVNSRSTK
jgi:conjugative relaxase-like TrwC/TraI family protein